MGVPPKLKAGAVEGEGSTKSNHVLEIPAVETGLLSPVQRELDETGLQELKETKT